MKKIVRKIVRTAGLFNSANPRTIPSRTFLHKTIFQIEVGKIIMFYSHNTLTTIQHNNDHITLIHSISTSKCCYFIKMNYFAPDLLINVLQLLSNVSFSPIII